MSTARSTSTLTTSPATPGAGPPADLAGVPGGSIRLTAVLMVVGALAQVPLGLLHPHHAQPNDSRAAFAEYARSQGWVEVHLGQYVGELLIAIGLVTLALGVARRSGLSGQLSRIAAVTAVVTTAVFAVQMAVDGVALKATVDHWAAAGAAERTTAFDVADGVRSLEKGLSALFHLNNGLTLLALGTAMSLSAGSRVLGGVGALAGLGFLVEAAVTARTGFSAEAGTVALIPTVLLVVFVAGAARRLWRAADGRLVT